MSHDKNMEREYQRKMLEAIKAQEIGVDDILSLESHATEYDISYESIGGFLSEAYQVAYAVAMEDGILTPDEMAGLRQLATFTHSWRRNPSQARAQIALIKERVYSRRSHGPAMDLEDSRSIKLKEDRRHAHFQRMLPKMLPPWAKQANYQGG